MIKANELRLGNWVWSEMSYENWRVSLENLEMIADDFGGFSPISLTPALVEKAGFVWNDSIKHWTISWGKNGVHFIKFDEYYYKFAFQLGKAHYKVLDHLHQLQNLYFALTGEELQIELNELVTPPTQ